VSVILVAGATGAIGARLCSLLVADGHTVVGTTRSPEKAARLQTQGVEPAIVEAYDLAALTSLLMRVEPTTVIHQLTDLPAGMRTDDMASALARNTRMREIGTRHLVEAATRAGSRRMVAQSLAFAYAGGQTPHIETDPIDPAATGVLSLERQVLAAPFESVILRYGRLWGPGTGFDAPQAAGCPLHVDSAARAAALAVTRGRGIYNIAYESGEVSTTRAKAELGWHPDFRLT
jgi:nucleoside-diphosphate-sugar epimerase